VAALPTGNPSPFGLVPLAVAGILALCVGGLVLAAGRRARH